MSALRALPIFIYPYSVAFNDDQFLLLPFPPSAFHTTPYGPVLRLEASLAVDADPEGSTNGDGEWRSLRWSNHLLSAYLSLRR